MKRWLAALIIGPLAAHADDKAELQDALAAAQLKSPLREDLQRPVDPRLSLIETKGFFKGAAHTVHNTAEVRALSGKLKPGDQLVLATGEWKDARLTFGATGTQEAPILIRPETPGSATFTGASEVAFFGSHLIITDLEFREVSVTAKSAVIFRLGNGKAKPADHSIVDRIRFTNCGSPKPEDWPRLQLWLMNVLGPDNTVANCTFAGMKHLGQMLGAGDLPPEGLQHLHILNNRFSDRPKIDEQNGYEIIQIGWSGEKARSSGSLIEGNTFENCNGETEIITLKASDVFVRHNTFTACQGALVLRHGDRVLVQDNVFDGKGAPSTGGVRLCGADHVIIGNIFRNFTKPHDYYYRTISVMAASAERTADDMEGYGRAQNVLISGNRFEHNDTRIAAGIYPRPNYPLLPRNIWVRDNVFTGTTATSAFDYKAPDPKGEMALIEDGNKFEP